MLKIINWLLNQWPTKKIVISFFFALHWLGYMYAHNKYRFIYLILLYATWENSENFILNIIILTIPKRLYIHTYICNIWLHNIGYWNRIDNVHEYIGKMSVTKKDEMSYVYRRKPSISLTKYVSFWAGETENFYLPWNQSELG